MSPIEFFLGVVWVSLAWTVLSIALALSWTLWQFITEKPHEHP